MMKKKKQSRSQSSSKQNPKKSLEPSPDSSPSPRLLSIIRSKLVSGGDLKHMFRGMRRKTVPGLSSQSRIVRCPKCHKFLQEPLDATSYKCGGCDSILHAKRWELEGNDNTIPEALFSSQNSSLSTEVESAEGGCKTPMRSTHREYNSRASPSVERGYHSETVYKHETSNIRREWMRRADEFSVTGESDVYASARSSRYNSRSNASEWTQHGGRCEDPPQIPFYPASPSPSSAYEYGYSSPFHGSHVSPSEQSYYHHQPNQLKQYGREGWFQESSVASPIHFPGETSDGKYYHWSSQSQLHDFQYQNLYEPGSSATPHRSVYSERSYQAAAAPHRSTYYEYSVGISESETSSEKSSLRDKKQYARERNSVVKRHVLPSAGGAPFATCSYCLELLQLPQVSPHGKHKRYQVRCGSCSGVLKFSIGGKADTVLDSPNFVDFGTGFADETVTTHQDSASEGHEEIYPDESHLSSSDNDSGDTIFKSIDAVSLETFADKGINGYIMKTSSRFLDSKVEVLQPQLKPLVNYRSRELQPASSETIGETSRIHLEQSQEAYSETLTEMDKKISERVGYDLKESGYEKNEILNPEEMVGDGSGESLEIPEYKNERMSESNFEAEIVAERPESNSEEPLNKNEYVSETRVMSENTRDPQEFDWKETKENKEYGSESTWEEIMGGKPGLPLEKFRYIGDSIYDSSSNNSETFEDIAVKEDTEHMSHTFSDAMSAAPQSAMKSLVNENQRFIGHPDQSSEATTTSSRIHGKQSQDSKSEQSQYEYEYENSKESQELDKTISDRVMYELEESRYETNETLEPGMVGKDGSVVSLEKTSDAGCCSLHQMGETFETIAEGETGEKRLVSHRLDLRKDTVENSNGTLESVYLEGSRYAGERTWAETMGDRAGLHLEEYESNYGNYSTSIEWTSERDRTFHMHEYDLGTMLEPEVEDDGRSESSSRGSSNGHESSEETVVSHESQDAKPDQSQYEYKTTSERQGLTNITFDIVRSELPECRYETNGTLEPGKMVEVGSVVSLEKASETIIGETGGERSVSHQMAPKNENVENSYGKLEPVYLEVSGYASERTWAETMGDGAGLQLEEYQSNPHEWTSERAPTFRLHEYELGTMPEPEEDAHRRSISSSTDFFNDHESSKERAVAHEEPWLVDKKKNEKLNVGVMVEDRPSLHLEKCGNEPIQLEETFEWTEKAPTFRMHESDLGTMLEPDDDADGRSESSSTGSFNNHESSKVRAVFQEEEPQLVNDSRIGKLHVREMTKDRVSLHLEKGDNESMKLEETFEWTSEGAPTFPLHESDLATMLEPDDDADGRSESSSRGSFNDHGISKEREMNYEEEPPLVNDSRTEKLHVREVAEDTVSLHLEECENESMKLDETFEWTSGRALTFRRREYELGTMLEPDELADGRSESSLRGSFNDRGNSKERVVTHEEELLLVDGYETEALKGLIEKDGYALQLEKSKNETMELDEALEPRDDIFRLSPGNTLEKERMMFHLEMSQDKQENPRQIFKQGEAEEDIPASSSRVSSAGHESPSKTAEVDSETEEEILGDDLEHFKKENEKSGITSEPYAHFYSTVETSDIFRLSPENTLEQERMMFHSEMSQDKQENPRQIFKQGEAEEDIPASSSRVSSVGHESPSKMAEVDSESEEEIDDLEHLLKENEKSGLTSESYAHFYSTAEPSEIVGLRHALYQTQSSPLRSPLTSPIHTPIGSPLHYLMGSQIRSPIASPMHSHIVSPLRSPINSSGSLSDVLFFGKKG